MTAPAPACPPCRLDERAAGLAAYLRWRAAQPAETFTDERPRR